MKGETTKPSLRRRTRHGLTDRIVKQARAGVLIDGRGLRLKVTANPRTGELRKSWVVRVTVKGGPVREVGLGSAHDVSLKQARERATAVRNDARDGIDPIVARKAAIAKRAAEAARAMTFRQCAEACIDAKRSMASGATASARVCIEDAARWAQLRRTFGKRLADHQVIRHKIAEMLQRVNATTAYLEHCAWRVMQGETPVADLCLLKVQATQTLDFCAREATQIMGGAGYMRGNRVERIYREVRVNAIGGGSEEIMRDLAARQLGL